ncbi:uncharacterized protein LOC134213092 [Armigeres subalbatus]|uniref:uncharacterized protein LOC134213092 n=1 Tax=Armigeres subalbatus TaxID=124917 RepID=UPI002ED18EC8
MKNRKTICWLLVVIGWTVLVNSGEVSTNGVSQNNALNATVSQMIQALGDTHGDSSQEHSKRGRIFARKGVDINGITSTSAPNVETALKASDAKQSSNVTTAASTPLSPMPQVNNTDNPVVANHNATANLTTLAETNATAVPPPAAINATTSNNASAVVTNSSSTATTNSTTSTTPPSTTTTSTSTTTTSTTTTTTTSTTTKPPKKPKITYSVDDEPKLLQAAKPGYNTGSTVSDANGRLHVEEPLAELSQEYIPPALMGPPRGHREYVVPVVTLIFAIPLLMGLFLLSYRRAKEFWLTRHYRRMDFLVDGMYNY